MRWLGEGSALSHPLLAFHAACALQPSSVRPMGGDYGRDVHLPGFCRVDRPAGGIEVFELVGDTPKAQSFTPLPYVNTGGIVLQSAVAREDALFLCGLRSGGGAALWTFTWNEHWALTQAASKNIAACHELGLSADGHTLFVAGYGLQRFDVRDVAALTSLEPALLLGNGALAVAAPQCSLD